VRKIKLVLFGVALAALLALPSAAMAKSRDRDHDKLPDKWEKKFHLSTKHKSGKGDPDRDRFSNLAEFRSKTNPRRKDSDRDGIRDANDDTDHDGLTNREEIHGGTNPCDRDSDDDGVRDDEETIGTVANFVADSGNPNAGVLTITLNNGSTLSGRVDETTEIECRAPEHAAANARHGSDDGGSNSGPGNGGEDNSGPGNGGEDNSGPGHGGDDDERRPCTTADLTAGTPVHEAEFHSSADGNVFEEVKLIK
jgi:hypothetical protein